MAKLKEALHYKTDDIDMVRCLLCPHVCEIAPNGFGKCGVRTNKDGKLYTLNYARVSSIAMDPIEKKPLYHFYPGTDILSAGTIGCNFRCPFCQNWSISQGGATTKGMLPESLVDLAIQNKSIGIAYTYNEPFMWYEFVLDCAKIAREKNLKNVLVTNGYVNSVPLNELLPYIDAMNIDLKAFTETFYHDICGGRLHPVLNTIKIAYERDCHIELTNLIIPGENDKPEEIEGMVKWIAALSKDIPLHFSRYFPQYRMTNPPTPESTLDEAYKIAKQYLNYVYVGNIASTRYSNTHCPSCDNIVISREGYYTTVTGLEDGKCKKCKAPIKIIY